MTEKKTAKKSKTSPSKKGTAKMEKILLSCPMEDKIFSIESEDGVCEIHIKPYLDFATREGLIQNIEAMYFPDGTYNKNYGDAVLEFVLFQLYTGIDFGGDIEKFDQFANGNIYKRTPAFSNLYFTEEYYSIKETIWEIVHYILHVGSVDTEQQMFYKNFNELFDAIKTLLDTVDGSLSKMVESVQSESGVTLSEMLSALKDMNAKDEKKIVKAVLDFQEEKAKKQAAATAVPRI